jgi:AcrR family transcriptional regulator
MARPPAKPKSRRPSRASRAGESPRPRAKKRAEPYHHGDLQQALLTAAESVLKREGLSGLTLRAVAREAGVSHAAPAHHFGDVSGLVSELAAIGFRRFNAAMREADAKGGTATDKGMARAQAYLAYALAHPQMYGLMFRTERLDMSRAALRDAADASFASLAGAIAAVRNTEKADHALTLEQGAQIVRAWSLLHGYAMLNLDGRLRGVFNALPAGATESELLAAMLRL